ncbi:exo-alpha-sialidase [Telluribacter sp. SYSU D00476]|uniref:sialidase family protein n=1 Tax=Telluribacter sp. SYSU D00476 TaxID=2811430 RepID=UPI001FF346A4|nr:sialidase family protein [Telluribacter sp. SYSU D00476]
MITTVVLSILLLISTGLHQPATPASQTNFESTVFRNGENGYRCYRIPAIVRTPTNDLLAFAEGRRTDCGDFGDVDLVLRVSHDNGTTWGPLQVVVDYGAAQAGNPAPVFDLADPTYPRGRLFLYYNTGVASEHDVREGKAIREVWYKTSTDAGRSWSEPVNITTQVSRPNKPEVNPAYAFKEDWRSYANTPGHAIQIAKGRNRGRLFVAANHSAGPPQADFRDYRAHGFYTDDHGKTFKLAPTVDYPGGNESIAAELPDGGLLMNIRNQSGEPRLRILAYSSDAGTGWNKVEVARSLPDPVCQGSMISYREPGGRSILIFSNLNSQTQREKLTVRVSKDNGQSWSAGKEIYAGAAAYSDLVEQGDGQLGVLYEKDGYQRIVYTRFAYDWLME